MSRWIWCILVVVELHLSGEEVHILRELARACLDIISTSIKDGAPSGDQGPWWMIFTSVVDIWGQKDLWHDAERIIRSLPISGA